VTSSTLAARWCLTSRPDGQRFGGTSRAPEFREILAGFGGSCRRSHRASYQGLTAPVTALGACFREDHETITRRRSGAAHETYREWIDQGIELVTSNLVVAEMQILVSRFRGADEGLRLLDSLYQDPTHEVVFVDRDLERAATDRWLCRYSDQPLSLADAVSFEVMRSRRIRQALALDDHFALAGFECVP